MCEIEDSTFGKVVGCCCHMKRSNYALFLVILTAFVVRVPLTPSDCSFEPSIPITLRPHKNYKIQG